MYNVFMSIYLIRANMNLLFPLKWMEIYQHLLNNKQWHHLLNANMPVKAPKDGKQRVPLMSPQIHEWARENAQHIHTRTRLVVDADAYKMAVEVYDIHGYLVLTVHYDEWSTLLSATIETELLETLLGLTQS